jgi:hypothetical protein
VLIAETAHVLMHTGVFGLTYVIGIRKLAEKRAKTKGGHVREVKGRTTVQPRCRFVDGGASLRGGSDLSSRTSSHAVGASIGCEVRLCASALVSTTQRGARRCATGALKASASLARSSTNERVHPDQQHRCEREIASKTRTPGVDIYRCAWYCA